MGILDLLVSLWTLFIFPTVCTLGDLFYFLFLCLGWCFQLLLLMTNVPTSDIIDSLLHNSGISTNITELSSKIYGTFLISQSTVRDSCLYVPSRFFTSVCFIAVIILIVVIYLSVSSTRLCPWGTVLYSYLHSQNCAWSLPNARWWIYEKQKSKFNSSTFSPFYLYWKFVPSLSDTPVCESACPPVPLRMFPFISPTIIFTLVSVL